MTKPQDIPIDRVVEQIKKYQLTLGYDYDSLCRGPTELWLTHLRNMVLALQVEQVEMLQELPWKPWKNQGDQKCNLPAAQVELMDCFFFLVNQWLLLDPRESFQKIFQRVLDKNLERLTNNYHGGAMDKQK